MTKHIIVISDGDPTPPTNAVINQLAAAKITVTAVLTAAHGNDLGALNAMQNLANKTKGRFYNVTNPKALPADLPEGGPADLAAPDLRGPAA